MTLPTDGPVDAPAGAAEAPASSTQPAPPAPPQSSVPAVDKASGSAKPPRTVRRRSRWLEAGTTLLLSIAVGLVGVTLAPAVLRATGVGRHEPQSPFAARSSADRGHGVIHVPRSTDESEDDPIDDVPEAHARVGFARRPLVLLERPSDGGRTTGSVDEGAVVLIVQELGDWVLVVRDASESGTGWTRKSGIAVR